ncbi:type I-F CRISPR-associated endoribonuclease Cas6/Csy4 [Pseudomonas cichorii]|uniref:type I-F CRISPR-associated endoribonuclease Cas6/Csy4 n=1 Tax=Pseudomonas cichorii TaxID=36746 RepID=UPI001C89C4D3|nr:type I-F CRISPR-associated endoribonuclease Cas6/Csy4 [Pseudomonas cichorii]MBX8497483.1 type I-F CRISPR-associated endoribonuclease Cas6/Csy4 [Pseudomonas cichorii]
MDHYLDLQLLPDPEFAATQLMSALMSKLHRGLHDLRRNDIGISFPALGGKARGLGDRLRLHGSAQALDALMALTWLTGMRDHVRVGELSMVPADAQHRRVSRVQVDSNPERTRRRLIKRHGITEEQARERIPDSAAKRCNLPFTQLRSRTSGQTFLLFIQHGSLQTNAQPGTFNSYGLSATATVPWF